MNKRHALALLWGIVVCLFFAHGAYLFYSGSAEPDTDILSLLPFEERDPVLQKALSRLKEAAEQRVIVLMGARTWSETVESADAYAAVIAKRPDLLQPVSPVGNNTGEEWLRLFSEYRAGLLSAQHKVSLQTQPAESFVDAAFARLHSPFASYSPVPWQDDPFSMFESWLQERLQETPIRLRDGRMYMRKGEREYVLVPLALQIPSFSISLQQEVLSLLDSAKQAAHGVADVEVLAGGVVLHAAAISQKASDEIAIIGIGSMLGVILAVYATFRSVKSVIIIAFSVCIGLVGALSVCHVIYGRLHIMTLVFGSSLVGVAEDYAIYFLCNRAEVDERTDSWQLLKRMLPGLLMTFVTTAIGYCALILTPFPGLHQMAFFSLCGLLFAWLTVIFWFPFLVTANTLKQKPKLAWYKRSIEYFPVFGANRQTYIACIVLMPVIAFGLFNLDMDDDIRLLQAPNASLMEEQQKINALLDLPASAQFYLVRGDTPEAVLQNEEALKVWLDSLIAKKIITAYQSLSNWVPSARMQETNRSLTRQKLLDAGWPLQKLATKIGADADWIRDVREKMSGTGLALRLDNFLSIPADFHFHHLWLGKTEKTYASMVMIKGLRAQHMPILADPPGDLGRIQWVDKVGDISRILGQYRQYMSYVLLTSFVLVYALLFVRFRGKAWRALLPVVLASLATLAVFGITGTRVHLFNILALMLLLGLGVDCGIFMQENVSGNLQSAWLEVGLSSISTLLSFGLLGLSSNPALRAFGLTLLFGLTSIWLLVPCFRQRE
jgi:predicted exporter